MRDGSRVVVGSTVERKGISNNENMQAASSHSSLPILSSSCRQLAAAI